MGQGSSAGIAKKTVKLCISFPGKTFLIGEYIVMEGAPALLVNTRPRFQFNVQYPVHKGAQPFHGNSSAVRFIEENKKVFSSIFIAYFEAYKHGFGLSGAEFNCVYLLEALLRGRSIGDIDCFDLLEKYLSFLAPKGSVPSGADVVSQWLGKVCIFSKPSVAESINWPFGDLSFALIQTGESLPTWKHLENLEQKDFSQLKEISFIAMESIRSSSESLFLQSIQDYQKALEEEGLTHPSTKKIIQELGAHSEVLAVKGCGAMGAELVSVFFKKNLKNLDFLKNYNCISDLQSLDQGALVSYG